jgi:RNA polymerase sigma-70 factor (ECF subfamily)
MLRAVAVSEFAGQPRDLAPARPAPTGLRLAFADVYDRFARVVHGIVLSRVGHQDADDVTQEVFLSIHAALKDVRDTASLPGWICSVARNAAVDHLRKKVRRPAPVELGELPDRETGDDTELATRMLELIRDLPEAYRETLVLRLVEGLSGPEIAARTGLTNGSLRVNLCRGMAMLRGLLEQEGWR